MSSNNNRKKTKKRNTVFNTVESKKERVLKTLLDTNGVIYKACDAAGITRSNFYDWVNKDEEFKRKVQEIVEKEIDDVEIALKNRINQGSDTAIIFYLKTKGKKRGYIERSELEVTGEIININVDFGSVDLDELNNTDETVSD
jgi:hypothetical protein